MVDKVPLAVVVGELDGARGPDVRSAVCIPPSWLTHGGELLVTVPRLAQCEPCRGGGCASCNYGGAFKMAGEDEARPPVVLQLPPQTPIPYIVRLPNQGPPSANALEPPGHWYVEVTAGARFSPGVTPQVHEAGKHPPGIVVLVAVALVLTAITCWAVL